MASRDLAQMVADDGYEPDMILAIARGGLLIGGALGYALSVKNVYTMNVEFYTGVDERLEVPRILPPAPDFVDAQRRPHPHRRRRRRHRPHAAQRAAVLRGQGRRGAHRACCTRSRHSVVQCDYVWKRTDLWINFPWSDKDPVAKRDVGRPRRLTCRTGPLQLATPSVSSSMDAGAGAPESSPARRRRSTGPVGAHSAGYRRGLQVAELHLRGSR